MLNLYAAHSWKRLLRVALLAILLHGSGCQTPARQRTHHGFLPQRLDRLRAGLRERVDDGQFAGAVAMIVRDNHTVFLESFGMRDREAADAMPVDAIFRIFSMTKPVTSVAVMMLQEEGRLSLTDSMSRYLPELG